MMKELIKLIDAALDAVYEVEEYAHENDVDIPIEQIFDGLVDIKVMIENKKQKK